MSGIPEAGEGLNLPIVPLPVKQSSPYRSTSPHLALSDTTRLPVRPVAIVIVFSASAS